MKIHSVITKYVTLWVLAGSVSLIGSSSLLAVEVGRSEPHGILQVFTPSYSEWDPYFESDRWVHHTIEILDEDGSRIRGWWHRRPIRLAPGNYLIRVPDFGSDAIRVSIGEAGTTHVHIDASGKSRVLIPDGDSASG